MKAGKKGGSPENKSSAKWRELLHIQAQEQLKNNPEGHREIQTGEATRLLHELQVYQIELEIQNEELRGTQNDIEKLNAKLKNVYDHAPNGYVTLDEKGIIKDINLTGAKMLGWTNPQAIKNTPFHKFIQKDCQDTFYFLEKELRKTAARKTCELRLIRKDGKSFDAELDSMVVADEESGSRQIRMAILDTTKRKQAETALQTLTKRFYNILSGMYSSVLLVGNDNVVEFANEAFCVAYKLAASPAELIGNTSAQMLEKIRSAYKEPGKALKRIREIVSLGQLVRGEEIAMADGRMLLRDFIPLIIDEKLYGRLWHHIDITDLKRVEKALKTRTDELEYANKELESFVYSVSHDLRAPLRAIDGFSKMVLRDLEGKIDEESRRRLNVVCANTEKMNHLIDDLLNLSRLGQQTLKPMPLDMKQLFRQAWNELCQSSPDQDVRLVLDRLDQAMGDRTLIKQVALNLLSNAMKYSGPRNPGVIEITSERDGDSTVFSVKDNGVGFDMLYYDRLFAVFHRLHPDREFEGNGVGLAIVKQIIHRHGGRVWADGTVNEGATFYFRLPDQTK